MVIRMCIGRPSRSDWVTKTNHVKLNVVHEILVKNLHVFCCFS